MGTEEGEASSGEELVTFTQLGAKRKILSEELVMEMILGTISLIKENKLTTSELKNLVTSPGGTTISALRVLEKKSIRSALIEAIVSASNRSKEFS